MKTFLKLSLCCLVLLSTGRHTTAQHPEPADPCGDPAAESMLWGLVRGRAVKVENGDTILVAVGSNKLRRVHLIGIEAPKRGEPFSAESRALLESLVRGKVVEVWVNDGGWYRQRMGRQIPAEIAGVVHLRSAGMLDVNLLMVQSGMARHKEAEPYSMSNHAECHYVKAEEDARAARRGLWRGAA